MILKNLESPYEDFIVGISSFKCENMEINLKLTNLIGSNTSLDDKLILQFFNAEKIASWKHLYLAAFFTIQSYFNKFIKSKVIELELLRWASAKKNIKNSIKELGVNSEIKNIALLIIGKSEKEILNKINLFFKDSGLKEDIELLEIDNNKFKELKQVFEISNNEYESLKTINLDDNKYDLLMKLIINRMSSLILKN